MKAVVIGAGMGGMTAGIALQRSGWDVVAYEQVRENKPVGAALTLWPNAVKVLNYLGLGARIAELGGQLDSMSYRWMDGRTMCEFSLEPLTTQAGQRPYPVARADLQSMLMEAFGLGNINFGMKMVAVDSTDDQATVSFADGSTVSADLVVAADGARSVARRFVTGQTLERLYSGYVNYNTLVPIDESVGPATQWTTYVGEGKRVSVMPVADGRFYTFFDVPGPIGESIEPGTAPEVLRSHFGHWGQPVVTLLDQLDPATVNRVEVLYIDPFHTWTKGRVVLVGDAAHNTTPDIGQGGGSAMEDAVVLSRMLATNTLGIPDALRRYAEARSPRAGELVDRATRRSEVTHAKDPATTEAWYQELWSEDGDRVIKGILANVLGNPLG